MNWKIVCGIALIVVGFLTASVVNIYLLITGIITIVKGGSVLWGVILIGVRGITALIVGVLGLMLGLYLLDMRTSK